LAVVRGAAELAARSGPIASSEGFAELAARVASPGGTTEAGLAILEADAALDRLVAATLRAAHDRSEELARG
jgi:pyrroline-5-carboxylate reductase